MFMVNEIVGTYDYINTLKSRHNDRYFANGILKCISLTEDVLI